MLYDVVVTVVIQVEVSPESVTPLLTAASDAAALVGAGIELLEGPPQFTAWADASGVTKVGGN